VRTRGFTEPVRLTFVNAAPANDYGYNAMPSRAAKLEAFDRFLATVTERYAPDLVYVACNTLSVLLPDTPFTHKTAIPIKGIVDTGVESLVRELVRRPRSTAMIFATKTTIDSGAYARSLEERGVAAARIVAQACPGLADTISEDREGARARAAIAQWVRAAIDRMPDATAPVVACLACTHYGYRKELFADALDDAGVDATVVDPNECAVDELFAQSEDASRPRWRAARVELVTRYALPEATREALTTFLDDISPRVVAAIQSFTHHPELF